jgi:uncharacterized protein YbjT (DUF2867 family)
VNTSNTLILVTGATGAQGGATARELLTAGFRVRVLTRHPDSKAASALAAIGAEVSRGDMGDAASLAVAMQGADVVFSVQVPDASSTDSERRHGFALVETARKAGVSQFIHTSVCEAGKHLRFPRWGTGYWWEKYWTDKWEIEEAVCSAGFEHWTVLKPAFLMDNFAQPKAKHMFPHLQQGSIITALLPQTRMQLIAADDVGAFARAAVETPLRFDRRKLDLATEALTMDEVAERLAKVLGKNVQASAVTPDQALAAGLFPGWVRSQEWTNEFGYRADMRALQHYGVGLTPFVQWVERHAAEIVIDA